VSKHHFFCRNGGASIFLCIILSAVVLTEGTLYFAARIRGAEADLQRCMRLQISQILSNYNESLLEKYGLYGIDSSCVNTQVFDTCFTGKGDASLDAKPLGLMTEADLRKGIPDYMQIRMPSIVSGEILSRFKSVLGEITDSKIFQKAKSEETSEWLGYIKDFLGQKDKWGDVINSLVSAVEVVDVTGKMKDIKDFASSFQNAMNRSTTLYLQGDDTPAQANDILNPDNLSNIIGYVDNYMNLDMPSIADDIMINEYAVSFFDSKIEYTKDDAGEAPESNLLGVPFTDIHGNNRADLEYILTGINDEFVSVGTAKILIYDMRIIINFASYLVDKEKMNKAKEIAQILSAAIEVVSVGTVVVKAEILQFAVLYVWALGQGFVDMTKLIEGESVSLFDHSALSDQEILADAISTDYRDYLGLMLLAVPVEWKLSRILTILKKDCGNELYTGVSLSGTFRGSQFVMEDTYDAYSPA